MKKIIVAAISENRVLGKDNDLVWHLPADLVHYHNTVRGQWVIMGRRTYESNYEPVPYKQAIIITRQTDYKKDGIIVVQSIQEAFTIAEQNGREKVFVLGGGEIYKQTMPLVDEMILTVVKINTEGDTYFPTIDGNEWNIVKRLSFQADEKNPHDYEFVFYKKALTL